ncbi:MAG: FAD binding domain-containing protein [Bacteroidetes bacterium]|nr:FAD binding domain-containing protein [Bacteroidota bacterium]MBL6963636.1 FAD binding domain-containing protein [Bacteroidota bacterium]
MYISDFNYHKPKTLKEALELLHKSDNGAPIAGGTDMLVELKQGLRQHQDIISLTNIEELKVINEDPDQLYIGAGTTHSEIIASDLIKKIYPVIAEAASKVGTAQIRNTGTLGGNLCTGSSCCDTAPVLIALGAGVEIANGSQLKIIPLKDFFIHNKQTMIKKGDIMTRIIVPKQASCVGAHYEKFGLREAASISVVSVAVMVQLKNNIINDACIVIGAVAPTAIISQRSTNVVKGKNVSELTENSTLLKRAGKAAAEDSVPIDDIRAGAQYRRDILNVLTQRAILRAIEKAESKCKN